jgi:hypothetical protein
MPVIPTGIPAYQIRPPLTTGDKGEPSNSTCNGSTSSSTGESSILNDTRRIFDLIEDERHLTAHALLVSVQKRLEEWRSTTHNEQQQHQDEISNTVKTSGAMMILPPGLAKQLAKFTTAATPTSSHRHHPHQHHHHLWSGNNSSIDDSSSVLSITDHPQHCHYTAAQEMLQSRHEQITKLEVS